MPETDNREPKNASQSDGINANVSGDMTVGGDVAGRDKIVTTTTTAGGHIIQAEAGATVIVGPTPAAPAAEDEAPAPGEPPFKGLQYFDEADTDLFFGRELLTAKIIGQLRNDRCLVVVGASGSGKSSIVRAGLVPALKRGEPLADGTTPPEGSSRWLIHILTPTAHPLEELAERLTRDVESVTALETLINDLKATPRTLHFKSRRVTGHASAERLLLVVDQFEELFTACREEAERKAFIDNLITAVETDGPTIVVITLRADFYTHCAQYTNLREVLAKRQEYIGPMNAEELRRAIEEPAKRGGWELESGLVDILLKDVGNEPGALPLLSHALLETWKRRRGSTLTFAGYAESGRVHGAIAKTAEAVFNQLKPEQQAIARRIFLRLTELGEGTQDTRRRAALSELILHPEDASALEAVLKILSDARLITTDDKTAEVAHEALIREWPTLRNWLEEDREGLYTHRRLTEAAQEWDKLNRDPGALYRGLRLVRALEWVKAHYEMLSTLERDFIEASRKSESQEDALFANISELSNSLDLDRVFARALQLATDMVNVERGSIFILDLQSDQLIHRAAMGGDKPLAEGGELAPFRRGEGLVGWVIKNRQGVVIGDLDNDPRWIRVPDHSPKHKSALAVPLMANEDVLGAMILLSPQHNAFDEDQLRLGAAIATPVGAAINNAELYRLIRDQAERLGTLLRAQQEEATKSRAILEGISDGVLVTDAEEKIILVNVACERILGVNRASILGQSLAEFTSIYGAAGRKVAEAIALWSLDPSTFHPGEFLAEQLELEDKRILSVHVAPVTTGEEYLGSVSVIRDITQEVNRPMSQSSQT